MQDDATDHDERMPSRVVVIGTTGSGKTTLARAIARAIGVPHIELDALHWDAGWTEAPAELFRERVADAIGGERWVVDGNYSGKLGSMTYAAADTVVWLDYAFPRVFSRLFVRTMRRALRGEVLWNGNRERLRDHFFTRDSLFLWAVKSHWRHRRTYAERFSGPAHADLHVVRVRRPAEAQAYLRGLRRLAGRARA